MLISRRTKVIKLHHIVVNVFVCVLFLQDNPCPGDVSPAVTLQIGSISIDIVPAINLLEWPKPAKDWSSEWLGKRGSEDIKKTSVCAVAKIHPSGENLINTVLHINERKDFFSINRLKLL